MIDVGQMFGHLSTVLGWTFQTHEAKPLTLRNFAVQGNAAEMCRLGCRYAIEAGVTVLCPHHDALVIEAGTGEFQDAVDAAKAAMTKASKVVLDGVEIDIELDTAVHWPERFRVKGGSVMWDTVMDSLARRTGLTREELEA